MLVGVIAAIRLHIAEFLLRMTPDSLKPRSAIDDVDGQGEAIDFVVDGQFHRRVDIALFLVPAYVPIGVVGPAVRQPVNQPRVAVEIEDNRLVHCEQGVEIAVC